MCSVLIARYYDMPTNFTFMFIIKHMLEKSQVMRNGQMKVRKPFRHCLLQPYIYFDTVSPSLIYVALPSFAHKLGCL